VLFQGAADQPEIGLQPVEAQPQVGEQTRVSSLRRCSLSMAADNGGVGGKTARQATNAVSPNTSPSSSARITPGPRR
jgi:hypothetical protein